MKRALLFAGLLLTGWAAAEGSILQTALTRHSAIQSLHSSIEADIVAIGAHEVSEMWVKRPGQMAFTSKITFPDQSTVERKAWCDGKTTTLWASSWGESPEAPKNAYASQPAPPDVVALHDIAGAEGLLLRLMSGDPAQFSQKGLIQAVGPDALEVRSQGSTGPKRVDRYTFDPAGLLKGVIGAQDGKPMATAAVRYLEIDKPIEPAVFTVQLPAGAKELPHQDG